MGLWRAAILSSDQPPPAPPCTPLPPPNFVKSGYAPGFAPGFRDSLGEGVISLSMACSRKHGHFVFVVFYCQLHWGLNMTLLGNVQMKLVNVCREILDDKGLNVFSPICCILVNVPLLVWMGNFGLIFLKEVANSVGCFSQHESNNPW